MESIVIPEKLRPPRVTGLHRQRLESRLADERAPGLALVLGPAGSGKTTLLDLVAAAAPLPAAWYRATAEDGGPTTLLRHLARGLVVAGAVDRPEPAPEVEDLVRALERRGRPTLVVVDDLHELLGTAAEASLERFLSLRPRTTRVLLGSRRPPRMNTPRMLVSGELQQLEADDLRFRSWEVEELFRTVYGRALAPETAAALTRRTGGWAAGLRLFQLATADLDDERRDRAVADLNGRSRLVRSYLARNVLDGLPADRRDFLVRSCALGLLTAAGCDGLLGRTDGAAVLADLDAQQFFTSSADGGRTYRYHPVLQDHLEVLLVDELGDPAARRLYARAAGLLERAGLRRAALRAHARAEDWGAVARLGDQTAGRGRLQHPSPGGPNPSGPNPSDPNPSDAHPRDPDPDPGTDDPGLALATARRLARDGRLAEAVVMFGLAGGQLDDPGFRRRCADERAAVAEWLPGAAPVSPGPMGARSRRTPLGDLRQVLRSVDAPAPMSALASGVGLLLSGDPGGAAVEAGHSRPGTAAEWERIGLGLLGLACRLGLGDPVRDQEVEPLVLESDLAGLAWLSRMARGLQATLALAADGQPWRLAAVEDRIAECRRAGDHWTELLVGLALGVAARVSGRTGAARSSLSRAAETADMLDAPVLAAWAEVLLAETGPPTGPGSPGQASRRAVRLGIDPDLVLARLRAAVASRPGPGPRPVAAGRAVTLGCLGGFRLEVDGAEAPWRELRPRARSLLMVLAIHHGRPLHREELVALLWPDADLTAGVRSLQVAISTLRQLVAGTVPPPGGVLREGDAYRLDLAGARVPHREFEAATVTARRTAAHGDATDGVRAGLAALECYTGDLLPEAGPAEWVVSERDRLRLLAARTAAETAQGAARLGQVETAIAAARRALELDRYDDRVWALLVDLLQRTGASVAAAATRRDRSRVLAELGL